MAGQNRALRSGSSILAFLTMGLAAPALVNEASAQDAAKSEAIVVTGSYIKGTPEDAALPVDVISTKTLEDQGSPTVVQMVKTVTASTGGVYGEVNRYANGGNGAGTATVNLRGFGGNRTLTLMNGRRLIAPGIQGANLNFVPTAAIGRVEVLKDGAAATYGSDAIGGVVNFITRRDLDGLEVSGEYALIDKSDGDYDTTVAWGKKGDRGNILMTAGYRHRSRLDVRDRSYGLEPFEDINYGGWSGAGNPGDYVANTTSGTSLLFRDAGCSALGGTLTNTLSGVVQPVTGLGTNTRSVASVCRFQFGTYNDLVNEEDHYQLYTEANFDFADNLRFHGEVGWNRDNVPNQRISPANLTTRFPTPIGPAVAADGSIWPGGGTSGSLKTPGALNFFTGYNIPWYAPGLQQLAGDCASLLADPAAEFNTITGTCAGLTAATAVGGPGVDTGSNLLLWRAISNAGHPLNADGADHQTIRNTEWRASGGFVWDITDKLHLDTAATYNESQAYVEINDLLVDRLQLGLNGFASRLNDPDQCTIAEQTPANAGNAAVGCYFFNPFSNAVAISATNGKANPFYRGDVNVAVKNDPRAVAWLYGPYTTLNTNQNFILDSVLTGESGFHLPGGDVSWALGAQYRYERNVLKASDLINTAVNPCVDSIDGRSSLVIGCKAPDSPNIFFGSLRDYDLHRDVAAAFGELNFPILDNLEVNVAVRYEDYFGGVGGTTNPKVSAKWQALDWLAFRGSAGTTFRAPDALQLSPECTTGVAQLGGSYRATKICGNPALDPETADTYNAGVLVHVGGFTGSVDYWKFKFKKELTTESTSQLFSAMFPGGAGHCGDPAFAALQDRFTFTGIGCTPTGNGVATALAFTVNGPDTQTDGVDWRFEYTQDEVFGGTATVGVDGTWLNEYARGAFKLLTNQNITFAAAVDRAGQHDLVNQFFSYPVNRAEAFLAFSRGPLNLRWQTRYVEGTVATPGSPTNKVVPNAASATGYTSVPIGKLDDFFQHDLTAVIDLPADTRLTLSVQNIFDEDPPDAPAQANYDYTTGNPLGRVFEIGLKKRF
jgi:iron complex outermembrane receptor protein